MTDALETFLNHQAQSTVKDMLRDPKNSISFGLETKYIHESKPDYTGMSNLSKAASTKEPKTIRTARNQS